MQFNQFLLVILTYQIKISLKCLNFQGFTETILTPLQASTVLFKANQRRAGQNLLSPQSPENKS